MSTHMLDYAQVDVFAENHFEGNALAIFTDATGLSTEQMQALARETNLSETAFILPRDQAIERERGIRVRIFTVEEELPFAGHPTLGTASWLYWNHPIFRNAEEIVLDLQGGPISVRFDLPQTAEQGLFGTMRQRDPSFGAQHDPSVIAPLLGLQVDDLDPSMPIQTVSTGLPFCIVPLRSLAAAQRLALSASAAQAYLAASDAVFFFCITPASSSGADWHCRMQFYNGEDPATGSASGCAIAYLVRYGFVPSDQPTVFEQGIEMLRPSRVHVRAHLESESVSSVFVGGRTIPVASGRFFLP